MIHEYAQVDSRLVRGIVESKLTILVGEVDALMNEPDWQLLGTSLAVFA